MLTTCNESLCTFPAVRLIGVGTLMCHCGKTRLEYDVKPDGRNKVRVVRVKP